jgi:quinoprotein glucose dehydrogenase
MSRTFLRSVSALALAVGVLVCALSQPEAQTFVGTPVPAQFAGEGQPSTRNGEWPTNGADVTFSRYSPLEHINADNFNKLEVAWRLKTDAFGPYPEYKLEGTPIMIKGVLYATAGTQRSVIALDARTGELIWSSSLRERARAARSARQLSGRGVSYWTDGRGDERIIYVTTGDRLIELNARTSAMIPSFGDNGILDIKVGVQKATMSRSIWRGARSAPTRRRP